MQFCHFTGSRKEDAPRRREESGSFSGRARGHGYARPHGPSRQQQQYQQQPQPQHYKPKQSEH